MYVCITGIFGLIFGIMLVAYDDGDPFALFKRLRCKLGWHKIHNKIGRLRVHLYYCKFCKKPRKYPTLKIIDGGNKIGDNKSKL